MWLYCLYGADLWGLLVTIDLFVCFRHFPGELLSVKPSTANHMPGLLHLNERVAWLGKWRHGFFSMTAVAALNVGDIVEDGCKDLQTNKVPTTFYLR